MTKSSIRSVRPSFIVDTELTRSSKTINRLWLVHDLPTEAQVLVLYPEAHLISLLAANLAYLRHGIRFEPVVADGVVEHGGELVADRMQVSLRVFESIARAHDHELVFPVEDAKSRDLVHALVP